MEELPKKELERIFRILKEQFGIREEILGELGEKYVFFWNKEGKVYILTKEAYNLLKELKKAEKFGLYILRIEKDGVRMSIEGSQIFGPFCEKNVVEGDVKSFLLGGELKIKGKGYFIVKKGNYYAGCCKVKEDKFLNYIPKHRRLSST